MNLRSGRRQLVAGTLQIGPVVGPGLPLSGGNLFEGVWIAFVGWLLGGSSRVTRQQAAARETLDDIPVDSAMEPDPPIVDASDPVWDAVDSCFLRRDKRAALVTDYGCLVGMVSLADLRRIGEKRWSELTVGDVMTRAPLPCVESNESLAWALSLMEENGVNQLVVIVGARPVGILSREEALHYLRTREGLELRRAEDLGTASTRRAA